MGDSKAKLALAAFIALALAACATSYDRRGVYHRVRGGDSIWKIARAYRVDVQQLAEYNNVMDPDDVQPGTRLYIPPRAKKASFKRLPFGQAVGASPAGRRDRGAGRGGERYSKQIEVYRGIFEWPVAGRVGSPFGMRNGRRHDGVDIGVDSGTPIHAAAGGRVVFAGQMRGYGNLILLRHEGDLFTAYAHNRKNIAKKGEGVKKGQVIAEVGRTGRATAPHLHFEIRHGQTARNPLFFLPVQQEVASLNGRANKRRK